MIELRDQIIIKEKVINTLLGKLGEAEAELFSAKCKVRTYNNEIKKQNEQLKKILEGEVRL